MEDYGYIVIPYCKNGSLIDFMIKVINLRRRLSKKTKIYLCSQAVKAVHALHTENKFSHGDIKPDNMVITDDLTIALIDFAHGEHDVKYSCKT